MAGQERRDKSRNEAISAIKKIGDHDRIEVLRRKELGPYDHSDSVELLKPIVEAAIALNSQGMADLPTSMFDEILGACAPVESQIKVMEDWDSDGRSVNPNSTKTDFRDQCDELYDPFMRVMLPIIAMTTIVGTDHNRLEREATGLKTKMEERAEEVSALLDSHLKSSEDALDAVKAIAADAGVSANAQVYEKSADEELQEANNWLSATRWAGGITLVLAVLAVLAVLSAAFNWISIDDQIQSIQYGLGKLFLLSMMSYVTIWCARNYRSHRHNQKLNSHRANALKTFRAFVEGTSNHQVKDAVLVQACNAAFGARPTGFDSKEPDTQNVMSIVDSVGKTTDSS